MPISMSARVNKVKKVTVTLDGETCDVWYRASVLTPRFMREMDGIDTNVAKTVEMLRRVVTQWDVLDDAGERVPVTAEAVEEFDFTFLNAVITAVMADINPDPTPAAATGSFS